MRPHALGVDVFIPCLTPVGLEARAPSRSRRLHTPSAADVLSRGDSQHPIVSNCSIDYVSDVLDVK